MMSDDVGFRTAVDRLQDSIPEETSGQKVLGADEYTQKRRQQDILDAWRMAKQAPAILRESVNDPYEPMTEAQMADQYHDVVQYFLAEIQPLALVKYSDRGEEYWFNTDLYQQTITPPESLEKPSPDYKLKILEEASEKSVSYTGLQSIVNRPSRWVVEFTAEGYHRSNGSSKMELTAKKEAHIPIPALTRARDLAGHFLSELGMDVEIDNGLPTWGFEEVEQDATNA